MTDLLAAADRVMAAATGPPTSELGTSTSSGIRPVTTGALAPLSWAHLVDDAESVPELRWAPFGGGAVGVYDKMRTDPQIQGLLWGLWLPIRRYKWTVEPNGASEQSVTEFAQDMGLPIRDQPRETVGRTKGRFNHDDHLRHALLAQVFGHMFFEQVGEITADPLRWRLTKLAPRLPRSLERIEINETGGLAGIVQRGNPEPVEIPVGRLAAYVWEREGANWMGRSILRAMYGPWLVKQRLVRVDIVKHERNGMGIPFARQTIPEVDPNALRQAQQLAQAVRAGEVAGATLPYGFDLDLKGVTGSIPDVMASIRYCDEVMARSVLMMFMMLGQTQSGARALGESFIDYISLNQAVIADWYADTTSEHVAEDWTDWNDGEGAQAPRIGYERDDHPELAVADLLAAIDAGLVVMSDEDEVAFRERYNLPAKGTGPGRPVLKAPVVAPAVPDNTPDAPPPKKVAAAAGDTAAASQANFEALQAAYDTAIATLLERWGVLRTRVIDSLVLQVAAATSASQVAAVAATAPDAAALVEVLTPLVESGAQSVISEAAAQGVALSAPGLELVHGQVADVAQATAELLTRSLSESAASRALALWGGGLGAMDVAAQVRDHLEGLAGATAQYEFAGLASRAQNEGRFATLDTSPDGTRFYASELNDSHVCPLCAEEDGREFASMDEARRDYPAGGYLGCEGGNRCRGTIVAVFGEAGPGSG